MEQSGLTSNSIQAQDVNGQQQILQPIAILLNNLLVNSRQEVKLLEYIHQNINGKQLWVLLEAVLSLHHYHCGMPTMTTQQVFLTIPNIPSEVGPHHLLNNMLEIQHCVQLELILIIIDRSNDLYVKK